MKELEQAIETSRKMGEKMVKELEDETGGFEKLTKYRKVGDRHEVSCVKGFWLVEAATKEEARNHALQYFIQYLMDGEYNDLMAPIS